MGWEHGMGTWGHNGKRDGDMGWGHGDTIGTWGGNMETQWEHGVGNMEGTRGHCGAMGWAHGGAVQTPWAGNTLGTRV